MPGRYKGWPHPVSMPNLPQSVELTRAEWQEVCNHLAGLRGGERNERLLAAVFVRTGIDPGGEEFVDKEEGQE